MVDHVVLTSESYRSWLVYKKKIWRLFYIQKDPVISIALESVCKRETKFVEVVDLLKDTEVFRSMHSLSELEKLKFVEEATWEDVMLLQRKHVDLCLCSKATEFSIRNRKLILLDLELCREFKVEFSDNLCEKRRMFLKACSYELCHEFIYLVRKLDYAHTDLSTISDCIMNMSSGDYETQLGTFSERNKERLYYIAGWNLDALNKMSTIRHKKLGTCLQFLTGLCNILPSIAKTECLPTGKIDLVCAFGALRYASREFFNFIVKLEMVYVQLLLYEQLVVHGSFLFRKICTALAGNELVNKLFFTFLPDNAKVVDRKVALQCILKMYSRMRGKYFCFKLLSKGSVLKVTTCQTQAVILNPKHRVKKELKKEHKKIGMEVTKVVNEICEEFK